MLYCVIVDTYIARSLYGAIEIDFLITIEDGILKLATVNIDYLKKKSACQINTTACDYFNNYVPLQASI